MCIELDFSICLSYLSLAYSVFSILLRIIYDLGEVILMHGHKFWKNAENNYS